VSGAGGLGLPEALERAASALREHARAIRPANGDPAQLLEALGPEAGASVLAWLLANEPADGEELAQAWAEDEGAGAEALRRVEGASLPKAARKSLRRVLHGMRSRGLEVPAEAPEPLVAKLPPLEDTLTAAFVSPLDPGGTRAVYLVEPHPAGGARLFELLLDAERGLVRFEVYSAGRSQVRRFVRDIGRNERFPAAPAPLDSVRALVERAAASHPADRPPPRGFAEWRSHVAAPPEGTRTPGELAADALGGEATPERVRRAAELVRAGELGPWPPAPEELQALAEKLLESAKGQVIVAAAVRRELATRAIDEAVLRIYAGPHAARAAASFRETAYLRWRGGKDEEARTALAAARALEAGPAEAGPLARAILETALRPVLDQLDRANEGDEEHSRLVKA
jgi:hypothetical protein